MKKLNERVYANTSLQDYKLLYVLGEGNYGMVLAAQNRKSGKQYAIKIVEKRKVISTTQIKHLKSEIKILNAIRFTFAISLECYFTNSCNIFIVLPEISGGHFCKFLKRIKRFDENSARFFAGQVKIFVHSSSKSFVKKKNISRM